MQQLDLFGHHVMGDRLLWDEALHILYENHGKYLASFVSFRARISTLLRFFGGRYIDTTTKYDVIQYRKWRSTHVNRKGEPIKDSTINWEHAIITMMFYRLEEWKEGGTIGSYDIKNILLPRRNPGSLVKKVDERPLADKRIVNRTEFSRYCEHADQGLIDICYVALIWKLSRKDLKKLRKSWLNRDTRVYSLLRSKTGRFQEKYATDKIVEIFDRSTEEYVLNFKNFRRRHDHALRVSGVNRFTLRQLRKSGATKLYRKTKDLILVQRDLAHSNPRTTLQYIVTTHEDDVRASEKTEEVYA